MKAAVMQCIKEYLTEAFEQGFQAANTGIRSTPFCFSEMAFMDMIQNRTLDAIVMKSFDRLTHSDALKDALLVKILRHTALHKTPPNP